MGNYGTISRIYTVDYGIKIKSPDARTKTIEIGNVPELPRIGALRMLAQPPDIPTLSWADTGRSNINWRLTLSQKKTLLVLIVQPLHVFREK